MDRFHKGLPNAKTTYVTLKHFTPDLQKIYTDISAVSVTFWNSAHASSELSNKLSNIQDVKNGHEKLNLAFVANLFNTHPHLDPPAEDLDIIEETREEKVQG